MLSYLHLWSLILYHVPEDLIWGEISFEVKLTLNVTQFAKLKFRKVV